MRSLRELMRGKRHILTNAFAIAYFLLLTASVCFGGIDNATFKLLDETECKPVSRALVAKLPSDWKRYADFVKACALKERNYPSKEGTARLWHKYCCCGSSGSVHSMQPVATSGFSR